MFLGSPQAAAKRTALLADQQDSITALNCDGKTVFDVVVGGAVAGLIAMRDEARPDAVECPQA